MKKKILAAIAAGLICVSAIGCGTTYQEAVNRSEKGNLGNGYFTELTKWSDSICNYRVVYDNTTKIKYLLISSYYKFGITPLYNADGTLQVYDGK